MISGSEKEERKRFRKKIKEKKKKKRKNLIAPKRGLVGLKGCCKINNHVKKFWRTLAVFE